MRFDDGAARQTAVHQEFNPYFGYFSVVVFGIPMAILVVSSTFPPKINTFSPINAPEISVKLRPREETLHRGELSPAVVARLLVCLRTLVFHEDLLVCFRGVENCSGGVTTIVRR